MNVIRNVRFIQVDFDLLVARLDALLFRLLTIESHNCAPAVYPQHVYQCGYVSQPSQGHLSSYGELTHNLRLL
jgi:hypothetical protein